MTIILLWAVLTISDLDAGFYQFTGYFADADVIDYDMTFERAAGEAAVLDGRAQVIRFEVDQAAIVVRIQSFEHYYPPLPIRLKYTDQ